MVEDEGEDGEDKFVEQFVDAFCGVGPRGFGSSLLFDKGFFQSGGEGCLVYWM